MVLMKLHEPTEEEKKQGLAKLKEKEKKKKGKSRRVLNESLKED